VSYLPYIAAAYALTILVLGGFGIAAWLRLASARRRLAAIDPRHGRRRGR
jgi:hypothetical protein